MIVPSSSFSAMLPVKPSVTTTSETPESRSRLSALPAKLQPPVLAEEPVRLDRQLVALLVLLADREQAHLRPVHVEELFAEHGAHVGELDEVLGPPVGIRARVEQDARAPARRKGNGDRRPQHTGQAAQVQESGGEHRAGVAGGDRRVGRAVGDCPDAGDQARVRLGTDRLGRLLGHLDHLGRLDQRQAVGVQPGRAEERHLDPVGGSRERAEDHLAGRIVATECVDGDAGHGLRDVEAERFDFAALVGAAGRADTVRALRRPALRARVDARSLELVRGAALIAARLRRFSLGDSHGGRP